MTRRRAGDRLASSISSSYISPPFPSCWRSISSIAFAVPASHTNLTYATHIMECSLIFSCMTRIPDVQPPYITETIPGCSLDLVLHSIPSNPLCFRIISFLYEHDEMQTLPPCSSPAPQENCGSPCSVTSESVMTSQIYTGALLPSPYGFIIAILFCSALLQPDQQPCCCVQSNATVKLNSRPFRVRRPQASAVAPSLY